ncbi:MAG TPA: lysophospholipid acyltransferase family protein [Streptosporangiaceae bacterium]
MGYRKLKIVVRPVLVALWRPRVTGLEHLPADGPVIVASNHLSLADFVFLGLAAPRHITFVVKGEAFAVGGLGGRLLTWVLRTMGQLRLERGAGRGAQAALDAGLGVLDEGGVLGIYPEGTRSPDGRLHKGRTGVGWLALTSGAPVIPVAMSGTGKVLPPGAALPRLVRVAVRFGPPVSLKEYTGQATEPQARRTATDTIMTAIGNLSGETPTDTYANTVKRPR